MLQKEFLISLLMKTIPGEMKTHFSDRIKRFLIGIMIGFKEILKYFPWEVLQITLAKGHTVVFV